MGLQTIIDKCSGIVIDRRKMASVQYTKNEAVKTQRTPTFNPWRITLQMEAGLLYSENRALLEALDTLDRTNPETIRFGNNPKLAWMFAYQGEMTLPQRQALRVLSFVGSNLTLTTLPAAAPNTVLFEPNDLIQIGIHPFPFTVRQRVLRGSGDNVTVPLHRSNFIPTNVANNALTIGHLCQFRVICPNMPTYRLIPGGYLLNTEGTTRNNALIEFTSEFQLYEFI